MRQSLSLSIDTKLIPTAYERHHMRALSEKEKKQIQRYCVYPKIALRALIMSFALCTLIVPLEMIDDLVFHNDGFQPGSISGSLSSRSALPYSASARFAQSSACAESNGLTCRVALR